MSIYKKHKDICAPIENIGFFFLSLSFIFYSSSFVSSIPVNSIYAHYVLAVIWFGLTASSNATRFLRFGSDFAYIAVGFLALLIIGTAMSIYKTNPSLLGYGSKLLMIFLTLASFQLGCSQAKHAPSLQRLSSTGLKLVPVGFVLYLIIPGQNANWIGIYTLFCVCFRAFVADWGTIKNIIFFGLTGILAQTFLDSQGVAVTCAIVILFLMGGLISSAFSKKLKSNYTKVAPIIILFGGALFSFGVAFLFNSEIYGFINTLSQHYLGDDLGHARSSRWASAFELGLESPITGYGLEAALPRVLDDQSIGAYIHNTWLEIFFRFGLLGLAIYSTMVFRIMRRSLTPDPSVNASVVLIVFFLILLVYDIGGYTHLPGTFGFWYLAGILVSYPKNNKNYT